MGGGMIRNTWHGFRAEASPHGEDAYQWTMKEEVHIAHEPCGAMTKLLRFSTEDEERSI